MTASRRGLWRLETYESVASTSGLCRARAQDAGEVEGLAVLARRQTAGRGTNGRAWQSPEGNLYLSLLLRPAEPARTAAQWSLLAAVALAGTIAAHVPDAHLVSLKWPNDVLLRGRKLAGILTESAARPDGMLDWLVIGFGANLAVAPTVPDRATACLAEVAPPPSPASFAQALMDAIDTWRAARAREGFGAVLAAWLARGPALDMPLRLRCGDDTRQGRFAGLAPDGSLLLATEAGVRAFAAGEVITPQPGGA